ncbi:RIP metalloprotease RseP [candidate division KSB1 bacterium]
MNGLIMAAQLILGLSILVILHEFGHYIAARAFGIKVEKFFLFFDAWGVKLFKLKRGDTEYGIGWLPLGGYVKIAGMIDESMDREQLKKPPEPWEFRSKPAWQRLIVMVSGVLMNLILGIVIFSFILLKFEKQYLPNSEIKDGIYAYKLGRDVGYQSGDQIVAINGKTFHRFKDVQSTNIMLGATITVNRNGSLINIEIPDTFYRTISKGERGYIIEPLNFEFTLDSILPGSNAEKSGLKKGDKVLTFGKTLINSWGGFNESVYSSPGRNTDIKILRGTDTLNLDITVDSNGAIGVFRSPIPYKLKNYTIGKAFQYGYKDAIEILVANIRGFGKILSGKENASDSVMGPIGIAKIYGAVWDWHKFWVITGLLSLILAFMNILPIPALDGGHVIFLTIETVTRRRFSDKFMEKVQIIGMIILITLMVLVIGNDIFKLFK